MKRTIMLFALCGLTMTARQTSTVQISPFGVWPLCEAIPAPDEPFLCAGFMPGHEEYLLLISTDAAGTTAYGYTATATLAKTGATVTVNGAVLRFTDREFTAAVLNFGGVVGAISAVVTDLAPIKVTASNSERR